MSSERILADSFAPGEAHFDQCLAEWPRERRERLAAQAGSRDVLAALGKDSLRPEDFLALLSSAGAERQALNAMTTLRMKTRPATILGNMPADADMELAST